MKHDRWVDVAWKHAFIVPDPDHAGQGIQIVEYREVLKLLARQHAAVVRKITRREAELREHAQRVLKMKRPKHLTKDQWDYVLQLAATLGIGQRLALQHLLAALATHRKGRT